MTQTTLIQWQPVADVPRLSTTEIHVWQIDLANQPGCPDMLDDAERARWQAMKHPRGAHSFCAMRTALRGLLGAYMQSAPAAVRIVLGKHGKPEIADTSQPVYFNLSHTGHHAVIACCIDGPIGIDIERTRTTTSSERQIAERVFSPTYLAELAAAEYEPAVFLRLWVQWEAQQKCLGLGLLMRPNEMPPIDFYVGHWDKGQLSVAWHKRKDRPRVRFLRR